MEWFFGLFVLGSFGFWTLVVIANIALFACTENERPFLGIFVLLGTFLLLQFLGDLHLFTYLKNHPFAIFMYFGGYLVCGTVWSVLKWYFYLLNKKEEYEELKKQHFSDSDMDEKNLENWKRTNTHSEMKRLIRSSIFDYKEKIVTWMTFWPWSVLWTLIDDFVFKVFNKIFYYIRGLYESIKKRVFASIEPDFSTK
ncbi:MAG: hypothetical protein HYT93_01205 [Parcubacteria group bacterium]|nr:hypothetical protein [Parcubacteria group bacterium]